MTTNRSPARYIFNELSGGMGHGQEKIGRGDKEAIACRATAAQGEKAYRSRTRSGRGPAAYFGERDHRFRLNVISESGGR